MNYSVNNNPTELSILDASETELWMTTISDGGFYEAPQEITGDYIKF